jgi:predicted phosphodiesterase
MNNFDIKMRFYLTSDTHFELLETNYVTKFISKYKEKLKTHPLDEKKFLICAGDICAAGHKHFNLFFEAVAKIFDFIFFVPGNHEFYGAKMDTSLYILLNDVPMNVIVLHKKTFDIPDTNVRIVGATLWSDLCHPYKTVNDFMLFSAKKQINDFIYIFDLTPTTYYNLHLEQKKWLRTQIENPDGKELVVVTHHMPSYDVVHPMFKNMPNNCFASDLNELIKPPVKLWCYGHTHKTNDSEINGVRMVCNPLGYKDENKTFEKLKVLNL